MTIKTKRTTASSIAVYRWMHCRLSAVVGAVNPGMCIHVWVTSCQWMEKPVPNVDERFRLCVSVNGAQYVSEGSLRKSMRHFVDRAIPQIAAALGKSLVPEFDPVHLGC